MRRVRDISVRIPNGSVVGTAKVAADTSGGKVTIELEPEYALRILEALTNDEVVRLSLIGR